MNKDALEALEWFEREVIADIDTSRLALCGGST